MLGLIDLLPFLLLLEELSNTVAGLKVQIKGYREELGKTEIGTDTFIILQAILKEATDKLAAAEGKLTKAKKESIFE